MVSFLHHSYCFVMTESVPSDLYSLSLHDALPISIQAAGADGLGDPVPVPRAALDDRGARHAGGREDRKSTRLNSSHLVISYAVFCLKKKRDIELNSSEPSSAA